MEGRLYRNNASENNAKARKQKADMYGEIGEEVEENGERISAGDAMEIEFVLNGRPCERRREGNWKKQTTEEIEYWECNMRRTALFSSQEKINKILFH